MSQWVVELKKGLKEFKVRKSNRRRESLCPKLTEESSAEGKQELDDHCGNDSGATSIFLASVTNVQFLLCPHVLSKVLIALLWGTSMREEAQAARCV